MQVTELIHALKIPFTITVSPEVTIDRFATVYLVFGNSIHLIDSGVAGADEIIFAYINKQKRKPEEIVSLVLTHSHPDHIGAAKTIQDCSGCSIIAHRGEQPWIEDTDLQFRERPVPGFHELVREPVKIDRFVDGGDQLELEVNLQCHIIHTPGHSKGSISLLFEKEKALFTADALPLPGDLPIYEEISTSVDSINSLKKIEDLEYLFSSWESPIQGKQCIEERIEESLSYLNRIHAAVISKSSDGGAGELMDLCQEVVNELGMPPFAVNPLVAKAFASSIAAERKNR